MQRRTAHDIELEIQRVTLELVVDGGVGAGWIGKRARRLSLRQLWPRSITVRFLPGTRDPSGRIHA
jgi:hypothetical protein